MGFPDRERFHFEVSSQSLKRREAKNGDINDYLFSLTCPVNNVLHICLSGLSYRFFIAAVRSIEILSQF